MSVVGIVVSIVFYVVSTGTGPPPPPVPLEELETVRAQGLVYASKIRDFPMASSIYAAELKPLAEKLWADPRYG